MVMTHAYVKIIVIGQVKRFKSWNVINWADGHYDQFY